jgi:peroxin-14
LKSLIFKALERNKEAQTSQLQDLQNELKSLKSLLLNRASHRQYSPGVLPSSTSTPALNTNLPMPSGGTNGTATEPLNAANLAGTETPTSATGSGSPYVPSRPAIPAWQLAAREKAQQASKGEEEVVQAS